MKQARQKTSVSIIAVMMGLIFVFALAVALFAMPATDTAHAATAVIDSLSLANINAGNAAGKYGNFSWDKTKIKSISASEMTTDRDEDPLCIVWTRPANGAYASALTFSVNITDSVGAITIRYDDPSVPSYISPGEKQSGTLTETVNSLNSTYEKIYFYISCSYMYNNVHLTSVSIQLKATTYKMTFTKGTGIKEAYLSTDSNAKSGSASGTEYAKHSTVYCFAKLAKGYKAQSGWTLIDGTANSEDAIYRVGTRSDISAAYNFGTISATAKTKLLARDLNGGGNMSGITLQYGQTADLTVPTREGYNFLGWNTNADGLGTTYGDGTNALLTAEQVNAIISDDSISALYAMWKIDSSTVMAFIDAIPDPVVYTQDCKNAIDTARDGYESLGEDEKLLVTNYDKLTAAESTYNAMQADKDALDLYKNTQKGEADDLALEGDSAACEELIANAKIDIDNVVYDCTKSLDDNKAAVDAILTELADALALQRDKEALDAYKAEQKGNADELAIEGDSAACEELITGAKEAIDALAYDEDKDLDGNKATVDAIMSALADALALQRDKDAFEAYKAPSKENADDLALEGDSAACEELIAGAKEAIDALAYDEDTDLDGNKTAVDAIVSALADALALQRDKDAFEAYKAPSKEAADDLALEGDSAACDDLIANAKNDIDALVYDEEKTLAENKAMIDGMVNDLADALALQRDKDAFEAYKVPSKEDADDLALEGDSAACDDLIANAKNAIDALVYDEEKTLAENKAMIDGIIDALEDALALQRDKDAFDAYKAEQKGNADELAIDGDSAACETLIANAKDAIDALAYDEDKDLDGNKAAVDAILAELADALALQRDKDAFDAYKDEQKDNADELAIDGDSAACEELIAVAKEAIDALAYDEDTDLDSNKATVDAIVSALVDALALQRDKDAFEAYKVPSKEAADELALESDSAACETLIANAKDAIDALAYDEDKDLDGNKAAVDAIVSALANALVTQRNDEAAAAVSAKINAIGTVEYTAESKAKIDAAKAAYEALTAEQKALVNNANTLTTAEATYATLKADNEAAEAVVEKINEIGKVEYKAESKAKISAARQAYDSLTDAQKALLDATEVETLTTSETVYEKKEIGAIVGIVVGSVAFVGGLIFLILFLLKKKKNDDKNGTEQNDEPKQAESNNDEAAK